MIYQITTKDEFQDFKEYYSEENLHIVSYTQDDVFTVEISDGNTYEMPVQCEKWIVGNSPKKRRKLAEIREDVEKINNEKPTEEELQELAEVLNEPEVADQTDYSNDLIYGKNKLTNIVSIDVKDDKVHIFREFPDRIEHTEQPMKYWIMSPEMPRGTFSKMKGNLHFKYLKEFKTKETWDTALQKLWKIRADKFTAYDLSEQFMLKNGYTYFKGMKVEDVSILSFDIETNKTLDPKLPHAYTMMIANTFRKKVPCVPANGGYFPKITRKLFALDEYDNELDMILAWCEWVREMDPTIMTGHNIYSFDLYYLHHRARILGAEGLELGRDSSLMDISNKVSQFRKDGSQSYDYHKCRIFGREIIDGFFVSIRYDIARNFPSYGLKPIIEYLGLEKEGRIKWDFEKDCPVKAYEERGEKWEQYKEYCIDDADDSLKIFDLMIASQFYLSVNVPMPFQNITETATGKQINMFLIRGYLGQEHSIPKPSPMESFQGAYSYGRPGVYKNVIGLDFAALYPSIMRQWKVYDKEKDPLKYFLESVEYFATERNKNKAIAKKTGDKYYKDLEQAQKVFANSCYGFMGAQGLHFNSFENAAFVTQKGRELFQQVLTWATGHDIEYWKEN